MRRGIVATLIVVLSAGVARAEDEPAGPKPLGPPPKAIVDAFGLHARYVRYIDAGGLPVVGSKTVSDFALREAAYLLGRMLDGRADITRALARSRIKFVVIGHDELTTDIPAYSDLTPKRYWDKRARGLGATKERRAVSSGAENLLHYAGDPYPNESILVHEFAHAIHTMGLRTLDPTFDGRLRLAYAAARSQGLWKGTYAATNPEEYFAEGVQSWFDTNSSNDAQHGPVHTRTQLETHDAGLARLLREVFKDNGWRYVSPQDRKTPGHLAGYDPSKAPRFAWPEDLVRWYAEYERRAKTGEGYPDAEPVALEKLATTRSSSSHTSPASRLLVINRTKTPLRLVWLGFDGKRTPYGVVRPGKGAEQATFGGHVWALLDPDDKPVSACRALDRPCRLIVEE